MLVKTNLPRTNTGLIELVELLEDKLRKKAPVSEDYLYRRHLDIVKYLKVGKEKIAFNKAFIEDCSLFLEYDSFKDFQSRLSFIQKQLKEKVQAETKICFLFPEERKNRIIGAIEASQKQDQHLEFIQEDYGIKDILSQNFVTKEAFKEILIWFIPISIFQGNKVDLQQFVSIYKEKLAHVEPFFLISKRKELEGLKVDLNEKNLMGFDGDFAILIQLLIYNQSIRKEVQKEKEVSKQNDSIIIHTGGGIGIGKVEAQEFNNATNIIKNYNSK